MRRDLVGPGQAREGKEQSFAVIYVWPSVGVGSIATDSGFPAKALLLSTGRDLCSPVQSDNRRGAVSKDTKPAEIDTFKYRLALACSWQSIRIGMRGICRSCGCVQRRDGPWAAAYNNIARRRK